MPSIIAVLALLAVFFSEAALGRGWGQQQVGSGLQSGGGGWGQQPSARGLQSGGWGQQQQDGRGTQAGFGQQQGGPQGRGAFGQESSAWKNGRSSQYGATIIDTPETYGYEASIPGAESKFVGYRNARSGSSRGNFDQPQQHQQGSNSGRWGKGQY